MARLFMDGFEAGVLDLWDNPGTFSIDATRAGRTGSYCAYAGGLSGSLEKNITASSSLYVAFKMYNNSTLTMPNATAGLIFNSGATALGGWNLNASPKAYWGTDALNNVIALSQQTLNTYTWNLIEIYYLPHLTAGTFVAKINGIPVIDISGVKTAPSTTNIDRIIFNMTNSLYFYIDDVIVDDANWIGPSSIQGLAVTGAGATTQFDPSAGSNYECVNEVPPSDIDYINTNVADEIDTYACGNLTGTINSIKAVQVQARCMQEGSPAVPKIQLVTRPSSTDRVSASKSVQTFTPSSVGNIWELNPDDSQAWESADVNGMEIGVKAVAS